MTDEPYDSPSLQRVLRDAFGVELSIKEIVVRHMPVGFTASAVIFLDSSRNLYVFIRAQGPLLLADVRAMLRNMNIDPAEYIPPHGDKDYFKRIGEQKFREIFPGKHIMNDDDTRYYRTLSPYNPALARIERVKGEIRGFHIESKTWRKVREYSFSRIALD